MAAQATPRTLSEFAEYGLELEFQGCSNPGLELANAFSVIPSIRMERQRRMPIRTFSNARSPVWLSAAMLLMLAQTVLYTLLQLRPGRLAMMPYFVGPKLLILAAGCYLRVSVSPCPRVSPSPRLPVSPSR